MDALALYVKPGAFRIFSGRKADKAFMGVAKKVFERDNYTCCFCEFQAFEYQDIVNLNRDYRNNRLENLVVACPFCSQCHFLESVGLDGYSGGQVLYLPEMSQADLNSLCHVLFCAMDNGGAYKDTAQNIYRNLRLRCQIVEKELGVGTSNPRALGQLILEYQSRHAKLSQNFLQSLRLLPSYSKFKLQLDAWAAAAVLEAKEA